MFAHTQKLCVDDICVRGDDSLRMKEGQSAAAGTSIGEAEVPAALSGSTADEDADTRTPNTPSDSQPTVQSTSSTSISSPASDIELIENADRGTLREVEVAKRD